jgi:geranylgeranyl diphosphate synthase type II
VHDEFSTMAMRTLEGQATELGWRHDGVIDLTPDDYLDLIMHKTCWYTTIHPLRVGALVGTGRRDDLRAMVRFGFHLGAAFQIQDDLLNLSGDEEEYGKELCGDLFEGKRTLPLIHLARHATGSDRETVGRYLALDRDGRDGQLVATIRALMDDYGSVDFAAEYASGIASAATSSFEEAFGGRPPGPAKAFLRSLIPYMLGRRS